MLDAIEERMKQDDETTVATQLVKMLSERGFKILTHMIHWGTAIERNSPSTFWIIVSQLTFNH